jgi:hypothetical protein
MTVNEAIATVRQTVWGLPTPLQEQYIAAGCLLANEVERLRAEVHQWADLCRIALTLEGGAK